MSDTMKLWNAVQRTDPANTKKVSQRGGFTAINAHSQIMEATRQFGPVGVGWGYETGEPIFRDNLLFIPVTLWHGARENTFGPILGGAEWVSTKGHLDSDAAKKATTDAVTKALSQLGFNADVFLGLFDDNKYVEQVAHDIQAEKEPQAREKLTGPHESKTALRKAVHELIANVRKAQTNDEIDALLKADKPTIAQASKDWPALVNGDPKIEEDAGLKGAVEQRRAEVADKPELSASFYELVNRMKDCTTLAECTTWSVDNALFLDEMDDVERREFEAVRDEFEASLMAAARLNAG